MRHNRPSSSSSSSSASALILEMDMCPLQSSFPFCFPWILLLFPFRPFLAEEGLSLRAEQVQYSPNTTYSFLKEKKNQLYFFSGRQQKRVWKRKNCRIPHSFGVVRSEGRRLRPLALLSLPPSPINEKVRVRTHAARTNAGQYVYM